MVIQLFPFVEGAFRTTLQFMLVAPNERRTRDIEY